MSENLPATRSDFAALDLTKPQDIAAVFVHSRYWKDAGTASQALVKIQAGRELGIEPFAAMQGIDIIQGRLRLTANTLASMVALSGRYIYRVRKNTDQECSIEFFAVNGERESLGISTFTMEDAARAKLANKDNWKSWPRAMLFARAMSQGVSMFCPDVTKGHRVYTEGDDLPSRPPLPEEPRSVALEAQILGEDVSDGGEPADAEEGPPAPGDDLFDGIDPDGPIPGLK